MTQHPNADRSLAACSHLVAGLLFVAASCASQMAYGVHLATASIRASYNQIQGNNAGELVSDPLADFRQGLGAQTAHVDNTTEFKDASISFNATASADYGQLKVGSLSFWNISDTGTKQSYNVYNDATVSARWIDVANVNVPGRTSGYLDVRTFLRVSGNMEGTASAEGNVQNNRAEGQLQLDITSSNSSITIDNGFAMGRLLVNSVHSNELNILPPDVIPVRFLYEIGKPFSIDFTLSLHTYGTASSGYADTSTVLMSTDADFTHTVSWGGISEITDHATGEVIDNWTITSESGFDYSRPFPVPEPSTFVLAAIGIAAICTKRHFASA
jgi:hypothetical protein